MSRSLLLIWVILVVGCTGKPRKETVVLIQPLGEISNSTVQLAVNALREEYNCKVYVSKAIQTPDRFRSAKGLNRFRADSIIRWLDQQYSDTLDHIMALTNVDISTTKQEEFNKTKDTKYLDWGIFGLGYMPGRSCIVSTFRLKSKLKNQTQLKERIEKVVLHEFGHNLGLDHCENPHCVMSSAAEKISNLDISSDQLCDKCKEEL